MTRLRNTCSSCMPASRSFWIDGNSGAVWGQKDSELSLLSRYFKFSMEALPGLLECATFLGIGYNLRSQGVLRDGDGQTALKVATCLTIPSVIARACT